MTEQIKYIPARLKSAVKGGHVAGAEDIDAGDGKTQQQVNNEASQGAAALVQRVADLEAMEQIVIDGGEAQIATGSDFTNPDAAKRAKVATVGAVLDGMNDGVYDVSLRFPAGGPNNDGKFTLDYILNNANTYIPLSRRHGGMQISFVQSSDNNYVKFFCTADEFTTDVTKWQGVDKEPTAGSKNLVESGGVHGKLLDTAKEVTDNIESLLEDGISTIRLNAGFPMSGYYDYYSRSVTPVTGNGIYYNPIEVTGFESVTISFDGAASQSARACLIADMQGNILLYALERENITDGTFEKTFDLSALSGRLFLYVSYNTNGTNLNILGTKQVSVNATVVSVNPINGMNAQNVQLSLEWIKQYEDSIVDGMFTGLLTRTPSLEAKTGYYYDYNSIVPVSNSDSIYYDAIEVTGCDYVNITFNGASSKSGRCINIADINGNVIMYVLEKASQVSGVYSHTFNLEDYSERLFLYISYSNLGTDLNVVCHRKIASKPKNVAYVDGANGNDSNTGETRNDAFATIQKAINDGFKTILVREGVYNNGIVMSGLHGISILIDRYYDTYTSVSDEDSPKIIIDGTINELVNGVEITGCSNCVFSNIEVRNCGMKGYRMVKSESLKFEDCIAHDIGVNNPSNGTGGFVTEYSDADLYNCIVYNIGTTSHGTQSYHCDGFNIHYTGTVNLFNCSAWNCEDDGVSHHDACYGIIDGGEWYNCGKGGIASPTFGSKVNISNVYCHDNAVGIYVARDVEVTDRGKIIISNAVCKNNTQKDMIVSGGYEVVAVNCIYDTITGSEYVTRFNS